MVQTCLVIIPGLNTVLSGEGFSASNLKLPFSGKSLQYYLAVTDLPCILWSSDSYY